MDKPLDCELGKPLLVFFDLETTGRSPLHGSIVEIGAVATQIGPPSVEISQPIFTSLIKPPESCRISPQASDLHGIYAYHLVHQELFNEVFTEFLQWLDFVITEVSGMGVHHYPVLVAHHGYIFDFTILLSEIKRQKGTFNLDKVHFFDTLHHLKIIKKEKSSESLNSLHSLGLQSIYETYFPREMYTGHRALKDAQNLARLFTETDLKFLLMSPLPTRSFKDQEEIWRVASDRKYLQVDYQITWSQADRLVEKGFSCENLKVLFLECQHDMEEFKKRLRKGQIYSKPLCEGLAIMLHWKLKPLHICTHDHQLLTSSTNTL